MLIFAKQRTLNADDHNIWVEGVLNISLVFLLNQIQHPVCPFQTLWSASTTQNLRLTNKHT